MTTITYEDALRALNEAVKAKGYNNTYDAGVYGGCYNVTPDGDPDCIVGWALIWLGVPSQWFLNGTEVDGRRGASAGVVCGWLKQEDVLDATDEAVILFRDTQARQDGGMPWGESVARTHLGNLVFDDMRLDKDVVRA